MCQTRLYYDIDLDYDAAANKRHDIIKGMYISGEFSALMARIRQEQEVLRHGLNVQIENGVAGASFPLISAKRLGRKKDASRGYFSTFGIATSCQTLDLTG